MGKLYYITGSSEQIREQVYDAILQWSQAQQVQPLQMWPMPDAQQAQQAQEMQAEKPNLYLYNYLAQGSGETLAQLLETYGEEAVEPIYLRSPEETEAGLMQQGIYKSYDPHSKLPLCLREIVETVFTGYRAVEYDFVGAIRRLQQQKMQQQQMQQMQQVQQMQQMQQVQQQTQQAQQMQSRLQVQPQTEQPKFIKTIKKKFSKKRLLQALAVIAWAVVVCIVTATIYSAAAGGGGVEKQAGSLSTVTLPPESEMTTTLQILSETAAELTQEVTVGEVMFDYNKVAYELEIIPALYRNGRKYYCISYGENSGEAYYLPGTATPNYQISNDRQVATVLIDETLWLIDEDGIRPIQEDVSEYALSAGNGRCVYTVSNNKIYCYDKNGAAYPTEIGELLTDKIEAPTGTAGTITRIHEIASFITNADGSYCAYNCPCGAVVTVSRETLETTELAGTGLETLFCLSEDGQWVYGTTTQGVTQRIARMHMNRTKLDLLGLADQPYYYSEDGTAMLCVQETDTEEIKLCYYNTNGVQADLIELGDAYWQLLDVDNSFNLIYVDGAVYQLVYQVAAENSDKVSLQLYSDQDFIWMEDWHMLYSNGTNLVYHQGLQEEPVVIPNSSQIDIEKVWGLSPYNELFYQDSQDRLHCLSVYSGTDSYIMDCSNVQSYCFSELGDLYYITRGGILGWIPATWDKNGEVRELYDFSLVKTGNASFNLYEERDSAVFLYVETKDALDVYRISEEECTYLGGHI